MMKRYARSFLGFTGVTLALGTGCTAHMNNPAGTPNENAQEKVQLQAKDSNAGVQPQSVPMQLWCSEMTKAISKLNWNISPCEKMDWIVGGTSVQGRPIVYADFGNIRSTNTTLIFATVHGDEITPLYIALQLAFWMKQRQAQLMDTRVVIAPLVNPDGFYASPRTRVNAHGVDVNRNFATRDWNAKALTTWKNKYRSDPRRNPGQKAGSEPETAFQAELIYRIKPQKILSVHSPLDFLDFDGPTHLSLSKFPKEYIEECERMKKKVKAISGGYFPGSLGNFSGHELGIPTLTLELPSADPKKAPGYWKKFAEGIRTIIHFTVPNYASEAIRDFSRFQ